MTTSPGAVFLSYASQDTEAAQKICAALRSAGIEVWFDQNELRGGDTWDHKIRAQVQDCALFVPIISARTQARPEGYFRLEWDLADQRSHMIGRSKAFIVPVCVDKTADRGADVPDSFLRVQWTRLPGGEASSEFADRIKALLIGGGASRQAQPSAYPDSPGAPKRRSHSRIVVVAAGAMMALVGGWLAWQLVATRTKSAVQLPLAEATVSAPEKSIAVLPFVDMSEKHDQGYMSDGIAEELLNLLAQAPGLKVIARTSSFAFKGKEVDIAEIGRRLKVAHVLEGSVRKSGDKVRITAQLIRAADSTQLWSETYDRPLKDVLAVQDEIGGAIVQALQIRLSGGELSRRKGGTQNLEAHQLYLRAGDAVNQDTRLSLEAASSFLEQATKLDPGFGLAWSRWANVYLVKTSNGWLAPADGFERVRRLAKQALEVSPDLAEPHALLMYVYRTLDWNWAAAEREGQQAFAMDPTNPFILDVAGNLSYTLGKWNDAERQLRSALIRDPLNVVILVDLATTYYLSGRFVEAEATFEKTLEQSPNSAWTPSWLAKTLLAQGKSNAALAMAQREADERERLGYWPIFLQAVGRQSDADEALQEQIKQWADTCAICVARTYAYRGDKDRSLDWLERAYRQKDVSLSQIVGEPLLKNLRTDPRYKAFLRKMNLPQ